MAYTRAIEANQELSGIFNIASGNHTIGEIADLVKLTLEEEFGRQSRSTSSTSWTFETTRSRFGGPRRF